jgi:hypothetical protein
MTVKGNRVKGQKRTRISGRVTGVDILKPVDKKLSDDKNSIVDTQAA